MNGERDVAIVGVHVTAQSRRSGRTGLSFMLESIHGALDDAGIALSEVDGFFALGYPAGNGTGFDDGNIAYQMGQRIGTSGVSSGATSVLMAAAAIRSGLANVVVIPNGGSQAHDGKMAAYTRPSYEFTEWTGSMTAAQFALAAQRHMHLYGTTAEQMARVAANSHFYASLNPTAVRFGEAPPSPDQILAARMIADPLTAPMCALVNDGGSCIVVTHAARARDCRHPPVWVLGGASTTFGNGYFEAPTLRRLESRETMLDGFRRAGVRPQDTDIVMCYDHFAHGPILQFEALGFCEIGEGGRYATEVIGVDGAHPSSIDGGNLAYSYSGNPYNFKQIEIVNQYRNIVPDLCPGWREGVHTFDRTICRKVRDPKLSVGAGPLTDGRHAFTILARD